MIRFAGVDLGIDAYGQVRTHLERTGLDRCRLFPQATPARADDRCGSVGNSQPTTPLPKPNYAPLPDLKLNQLVWPTGATRFAHIVLVVTRSQLVKVLGKVEGTARNVTPQQLVIGDSEFSGTIKPDQRNYDGNGRVALSVGMRPLEAQPVDILDKSITIDGGPSDDDLWLLPLVDDRYFWQWKPLPYRVPDTLLDSENRVPETTTTIKEKWHGWLRIIRYAIDKQATEYTENLASEDAATTRTGDDSVFKINLTLDDIDTDRWFYPDRAELDRPGHCVADIFDAVAHSMGRRVVRDFDGSVSLLDPDDSFDRMQGELGNQFTVAGGLRMMPIETVQQLANTLTAGSTSYFREGQVCLPEYLDVTFRKLVEFDDSDLPDDVTDSADAPSQYDWAQMLHGPATRVIRVPLDEFGAKNTVQHASRSLFSPSWVGRQWYAYDDDHEEVRVVIDDGACDGDPDEYDDDWHENLIDISDTHANQAAGLIDDEFYGDRYFRYAATVAQNYVYWASQKHAYCLAGFVAWQCSGFDDYLLIDAQAGKTFVHSHSHEFGCATHLVQLHRQGAANQDQIVGIITSQWTLHPKELERLVPTYPEIADCALQDEEGIWKELPVREDCLITDRFDWSWQWAEAFVRPLIPTDPWAPTNSIEHGRTMCWAGSPVVGVTRSRKVIDRLRELLLCDTLPAADGDEGSRVSETENGESWYFDRTRALPTAHGVVYLRWNGFEWQFIELDCLPGATDAIAG